MNSKKNELSAHVRKENIPKLKVQKEKFTGSVLDTGAARSFVLMKQAKAL